MADGSWDRAGLHKPNDGVDGSILELVLGYIGVIPGGPLCTAQLVDQPCSAGVFPRALILHLHILGPNDNA